MDYANHSMGRVEDKIAERLFQALIDAHNAPVIQTGERLPDIVGWAEENFYIIETARPIIFQPHQRDILRIMSAQRGDGRFEWTTLIYSTIKKSGKTAAAALYARWAAETWGPYQEVYNLGNKLQQAKDRGFRIAKRSIELAPSAIKEQWDIQQTIMTHRPSGSFIQALPIAGAGEAGGNQSLTLWTELWGFQYDEALLMWDELKPVPTRVLSQRFIDTYAGFEGVSALLKKLWDLGLMGERLHDSLPIYGNREAGLCAYIDTGVEARRMPWQRGIEGQRYYAEQEASENPLNYRRHHLNEWVTSQDALIEMPMWDALEMEGPMAVERVVVGVDASVSGDCTALSVVGLDTDGTIIEASTQIWKPNGKLDYGQTLEPALEAVLTRYKVVCVAYDPYQLHDLMTRLEKKYRRVVWYAFPQGGERLQADTALVNRIRQGTLIHSGNQALREHVQNADGKMSGDSALRIVKRQQDRPVDGVVALSMGAWKAAELLGKGDRQGGFVARVRFT